MALRIYKLILENASALDAVSETINISELGGVNNVGFYIVGSAGISAGAVQIEDAHSGSYAGSWYPQGSPVTVGVGAVKKVSITDVFAALRARISTGVVGGTVSVYVVAGG